MQTMRKNLYPSLNKYFENMTELAHAGCMSRVSLWECLTGTKEFTRAQRKAISANIAVRILNKPIIDYEELWEAIDAWHGKFDEIYKSKEGD